MGTDSFNGSGSRFNSRFVQGEEIYAKQLNDLAAGLQASLPTPYLGGGTVVSYIPGGSIITSLPDSGQQQTYEPPDGGEVQLTIPNPEIPGVAQAKVAKLSAIIQDYWTTRPLVVTAEFYLTGVWAYPTGSKTAGTVTNSPWMDNGGFVTVKNAANGGADNWGVYIVRQPLNKPEMGESPRVVIMSDDPSVSDDAFEKTTPWGDAGTSDVIQLYSIAHATAINVDGSFAGNFVDNFSNYPSQYNYNCQRVKIASMVWDGSSSWMVFQYLSGSVTMPNTVQYSGSVIYTGAPAPSPDLYWPQFESQCNAWNGTWTGYTKAVPVPSQLVTPAGFPS
jgi:hypothetical protein